MIFDLEDELRRRMEWKLAKGATGTATAGSSCRASARNAQRRSKGEGICEKYQTGSCPLLASN